MEIMIENKVWTEEELMSLPQDGNKYELIGGEIEMSPTGMEHGSISSDLSGELRNIVKERSLGLLYDSSTGFRMKNGDLLSPDISFVSIERLRQYKHSFKKFFQGSPDLVVEVLSPNDTIEKLHYKIKTYFENDTKLLWVVNPEDETVIIYHSMQPDKTLKSGDLLDGEDIVPGFSYPVAELFAELNF
jgi:Uma2 family endonuclease